MSIHRSLIAGLLLITVHVEARRWPRGKGQFEHWFPDFSPSFKAVLRNNCSEEYSRYLGDQINPSFNYTLDGADYHDELAQPVVNCILENLSEFIKSNLASAQVVLGLVPPMLATMSSSPEETSMLFVVGRRPFLALCIAAGSAAVFPTRPFDSTNPLGLLQERPGRMRPPRVMRNYSNPILVFEYLIIGAAIANIALVCRDFDFKCVVIWGVEATWLTTIWAFVVILVHMSGWITTMLRIRRISSTDKHLGQSFFENWIKPHITPFDKQKPVKARVVPESSIYLFFTWLTGMLAIAHVIYGTVTLSGLTFISQRDSLWAIGRLFASVVVCRFVLMYELSCLRDAFNHVETSVIQVFSATLGKVSEHDERYGI